VEPCPLLFALSLGMFLILNCMLAITISYIFGSLRCLVFGLHPIKYISCPKSILMTDGLLGRRSETAAPADITAALAIQGQCNRIVAAYRAARITKENAIAAIRNHIPIPPGALGLVDPIYILTIESYTKQLDAHERELAEAAERGRDRSRTLTPRGNRTPPESLGANGTPAPPPSDPGSGNGGSEAGSTHGRGRQSQRRRSRSHRDRSASSTGSASSGPIAKRPKFDEAILPWTVDNIVESASLHPDLQETNRLIRLYAIDPKRTKQSITMSVNCPELPDSEWSSILAGRAVDLDIVFSGFHSNEFDHQRESNLGGGARLIMGANEATKKVSTHHQWFIAWTKTSAGTEIAFPHRKKELAQYLTHISGLFAAVAPGAHHRIINYDKAVRRFVGLVRNVRLTDYAQFEDLKTSWLTSYGANVVAEGSISRGPQSGGIKKVRSKEACRNWNANKCKVAKCNYAHVCSECGGKHTQIECPVKK
jgi:hypothetical protein